LLIDIFFSFRLADRSLVTLRTLWGAPSRWHRPFVLVFVPLRWGQEAGHLKQAVVEEEEKERGIGRRWIGSIHPAAEKRSSRKLKRGGKGIR
jgi:hypothetical protein